jgi:hypothetical protein
LGMVGNSTDVILSVMALQRFRLLEVPAGTADSLA